MKNNLIIIMVMAIVIFGCKNEEEIVPAKVIPVTVTKVEQVNISIPVITSGKIKADAETVLSFKTGGIVKQIYVDEGETVRKGKLLAELNLSEMNAQVLQANAAFDKAERDFERIGSLYKDSVVTLEQYQNVETAYNMSKANLNIAQFNMDYSKIKAPTNGKIYKKFVEVNELVSPGAPIIIFGSTDDSWIIKVGVTDKHISKLKLMDKANINLDAHPAETFSAIVSEIASSASQFTGTYEIELTLNNTTKNIVSGMIANVEIFPSEKVNCFLLPVKALVNANGNIADVYTVSGDGVHVEKINIEIGSMIEDKVIINRVDNSFDKVILDGVEYLTDNSKIRIVTTEDLIQETVIKSPEKTNNE